MLTVHKIRLVSIKDNKRSQASRKVNIHVKNDYYLEQLRWDIFCEESANNPFLTDVLFEYSCCEKERVKK